MTTTLPPPTERQLEILAWIAAYIDKHGYSPTVREIGDHYGFTLNGTSCHLRALRSKGCIEWRASCSRTIRVTELGEQLLGEEVNRGG
jgi:repressor LexA